jgi:hypothetical protein
MQRWEYLSVKYKDVYAGYVYCSDPQPILDYLRRSFPTLGTKGVAMVPYGVGFAGVRILDVMNALGADGWEAVGQFTQVHDAILMKRPVG